MSPVPYAKNVKKGVWLGRMRGKDMKDVKGKDGAGS